MEVWVCQPKMTPDGPFPDFPASFPRPAMQVQEEPINGGQVIGFVHELTPLERAEMRKRGNKPLDIAQSFRLRGVRQSDGVRNGLSVDGSTRLPDDRNWDLIPPARKAKWEARQ